MSICASTGATRTQPCRTCGAEVLHKESETLSCANIGRRFWHADKHRAPCGRWCIGGGIGRDQRAEGETLRQAVDNSHGNSKGCPACEVHQ